MHGPKSGLIAYCDYIWKGILFDYPLYLQDVSSGRLWSKDMIGAALHILNVAFGK